MNRLRRAAALCALWSAVAGPAAAQTPSFAIEAQQRLRLGPNVDIEQAGVQRRRLIDTGEARLAAGDTQAARQAFEQAAGMAHDAEIELGIVRTSMQGGDYRSAMAFAAHTAGAHLNSGMGSALYGWLLFIGGQDQAARQVLRSAALRLPDDPAVAQVSTWLQGAAPGAKSVDAGRFGPYAQGDEVPGEARVVGSGARVNNGRWALVPDAAVAEPGRIWLRDGLGRTHRAQLLRHDEALGVALLGIDGADAMPDMPIVSREGFAGSPAFAIGYPEAAPTQAQWPLLSMGFIGRPAPDGSARALGFALPRGVLPGAAVFDAGGQWLGLAVPGADGRPRLTSAASLQGLWAPQGVARPASEGSALPAARIGVDDLYERALHIAVQVIVAPSVARR